MADRAEKSERRGKSGEEKRRESDGSSERERNRKKAREKEGKEGMERARISSCRQRDSARSGLPLLATDRRRGLPDRAIPGSGARNRQVTHVPGRSAGESTSSPDTCLASVLTEKDKACRVLGAPTLCML